jgi:hypothetical protein
VENGRLSDLEGERSVIPGIDTHPFMTPTVLILQHPRARVWADLDESMRKSPSTAAEGNEAETVMMTTAHSLSHAYMVCPYNAGEMGGGERS